MNRVVIPKELADMIEKNRYMINDDLDLRITLFKVIAHTYEENLYENGLTYIDVVRAVMEGYEVKKEYLSLEQVFELEDRTLVRHKDLTSIFEIKDGGLGYKDNFYYLKISKCMLSPKWYVVEYKSRSDVR